MSGMIAEENAQNFRGLFSLTLPYDWALKEIIWGRTKHEANERMKKSAEWSDHI